MVLDEGGWKCELEVDEEVSKGVGLVVSDSGDSVGASNAGDMVDVGVRIDTRDGVVGGSEFLLDTGSRVGPPFAVVRRVAAGCMSYHCVKAVAGCTNCTFGVW